MNSHKLNFVKCLMYMIVIIKLLPCNGEYLCKEKLIPRQIEETVKVKIHSGFVLGFLQPTVTQDTEYFSFQGIPYAKPPVGPARFLPPEDVEPWSGVHAAHQHGPVCPQMEYYIYGNVIGKEDCLFINVYSPKTSNNPNEPTYPWTNERRAVMVWIHGGAFVFGSGNSDLYGPDFLLDNDVIVVTFNYRLGAPGFMNMNNSQIPGNAGLKDQSLALKWVKRNIANFGGDPDRITIFGQSAGAVSVDLHSISKMSQGLFKRSISLSGSYLCQWGFTKKPLDIAYKLSEQLREKEFDKDKFTQKVISEDIITLTTENNNVYDFENFALNFVPSIETWVDENNTFIDECVYEKLQRGGFHRGEHIAGITSTELNLIGAFFEMLAHDYMPGPLTEILKILTKHIERPAMKRLSYEMFDKPINTKIDTMKKYSEPGTLFAYVFDYKESDRLLKNGVTHTDDLKYIFMMTEKNQVCSPEPTVYKDIVIRNKMVKLLTNFAKYGKPSTPKDNIVYWRAVNEENGNDAYLHIQETGAMVMVNGRVTDAKELNETANVIIKNECERHPILDLFKVFELAFEKKWSRIPFLVDIGKALYGYGGKVACELMNTDFAKKAGARFGKILTRIM